MPSFDREGALKSAEKALRQGRIDAAIAEYVRIVEAQPRDWNSANALGDLYVRAGQVDKGIGHYVRIADHLENEGFYPKAAALYKKILKIKPGDEPALMQLGEIASRQGLLADAKQYFNQLVERRKARGDQRGAAELSVRVGTLDPDDLDARLLAAKAAAGMGDVATALHEYREVATRLEEQDRADDALNALVEIAALDPSDTGTASKLAATFVARGEIDRARPYLSTETAGHDAGLWLALAESALKENRLAEGRTAISRAIGLDPARREAAVVLGCRLAETSPEAGYQVVDAVADAAVRAEDFAAAAAALHEFVTRVRFHLVALMRLVEICVDGQLEATMFEAQAQLADAYLEVGRALEARIISEDLVAREPWNRANIERFRKSLVMLGEGDPDAIIAERLSGESPFLAADFIDLNEGEELDGPVPEPPAPAPAEPRKRAKADTARAAAPKAAEVPAESADAGAADEAAEQYRLALTYHEMGMAEDAMTALEQAAKSPRQRFDAASMLGRLHLEQDKADKAVEWFERAAEAPAPTPDAGRALSVRSGQHARNHWKRRPARSAIFAELEAELARVS
ncbi:MAG: tetratricopeptide repeat protein [Vicinamibacterales bacterium]